MCVRVPSQRAKLLDLNSLNGCFVNDVRFQNAAVDVKPGDRIRFGYDPAEFL
jgi:pSer/pThr/pTyr-binding forkhead associated (FHA) protein